MDISSEEDGEIIVPSIHRPQHSRSFFHPTRPTPHHLSYP